MIQWFPGHMYKASKEYRKILPEVDLVIEVLDARLPFSSSNPMLQHLNRDKPVVKILNKSDMAEPEELARWQTWFEGSDAVRTLACNPDNNAIHQLPALCRQLVPVRPNRSSQIVAIIGGIPNVGKSSLINKLNDRPVAKTGNEAAVTRFQQQINVSNELMLIDTPGMLWGNIDNENSGYRLAATGAIRDTAIDIQDVAFFVAEYMLKYYPQRLQKRYQLESIPDTEFDLMERIARKRGCIVTGGHVDLEKVSRLLIAEFRSGELGKVCLETPEMMRNELTRLEVLRTEKAQKKIQRKLDRKKKKGK
jgi:ribosome biogenesis GTPase A